MTASRQQQKLFFALVAEGLWDKDKAKAQACKLYSLKEFSDISSDQISPLINALKQKLELKENDKKHHIANGIHARIYDMQTKQMLYSRTATVGHDKGILIYFPIGYDVNREVKGEEEIDIMLGTGKYDIKNKEAYRYDIFIASKNDPVKYLIDMDEKKLQWIAINMKTDEKIALYKFGKIKIVGSVYEEVGQ